MAAMSFQLLSLIFDLIHWINYSKDGRGVVALNELSKVLELTSECIMTLIVLMLANGWMTLDLKQEKETEDIYVPMGIVVVMLYVIISSLSFIERDAYNKYSDFNDIQGYTIIAVKLCLAVAQVYFYHKAAKKVSKQQSQFLD